MNSLERGLRAILGPKTVFIEGFVYENKETIALSRDVDHFSPGQMKVKHAMFCAISGVKHSYYFGLNWPRRKDCIFCSQVQFGRCVINSRTGYEAKFLKKGYPLNSFPSGGPLIKRKQTSWDEFHHKLKDIATFGQWFASQQEQLSAISIGCERCSMNAKRHSMFFIIK